MKPDPDYLKQLLTAFQSAPNPTTDIQELKDAGLPFDDPRFEFHMMQLKDDGFVECAGERPITDQTGIGLSKSADGHLEWSVIPLRLTATGNKFAEVMGNNEVLRTLKKGLVGASISVMYDVAIAKFKTELAKHTGLQL